MAAGNWRAAIAQELRRHRPVAVVVYVDDELKTYKPSGGERGRWKRLADGLPEAWQRVELRDKDEAILWSVDNSEAVVDQVAAAKGGGVSSELAQLAKLFLAGQDQALARQGDQMARVVQSYERVVELTLQRMTELERLVSASLQSAYDATLASAEAQAVVQALERAKADGGGQSPAEALMFKLLEAKGVTASTNGAKK